MTRPFPPWSAAVDDMFVCTAVRRVAEDTVTVVFAPRRPATVSFDAGQYVTIEFGVDGVPVNRCYSIASPPTRPERLAITVRSTDDGVVSRWIHDGGLRPDDEVRIGDPQGAFTLAAHPADAYLFLTAGSGITPVLSILRELYDLGREADVVLVHSQRSSAQIAYRDELRQLADAVSGVTAHFVCSEHDPRDDHAIHGRVDGELLASLVPDLATRETFVCGPVGYREAMRSVVVAAGGDPRRVHEESYRFEPLDTSAAQPSSPVQSDGTQVFTIEFVDRQASVPCAADTTILEAAMAAGVDVPSSCTQGLCGTCKSTLTAGEVDMQHNGGIRPREIAAGKVLLCCSRPLTDLVITT